ncbi:MAG TPA: hypothetical protein VK661_07610, partial [Planctomycetota bacterium]|nr:hypothetical protein [Planctomycetota bacterium]
GSGVAPTSASSPDMQKPDPRFPREEPTDPKPDPKRHKEKPPRDDPDPEKPPRQDPQEPNQDSIAPSEVGTSWIKIPDPTSLGGPYSFFTSTATLWPSTWRMRGSFDVSGTLANGQTCCASGDIDSFSFDKTTSFQVGFNLGSWEVALWGFQDIVASSITDVTVCSTGKPDTVESAQIDMRIEWWVALACRGAIVEARAGPLLVQAGIEIGVFESSIEVKQGQSLSTNFAIDETVRGFGGTVGAFASLACSAGKFQGRAVLDFILAGVGNTVQPSDSIVLSVGVGIGF